MKQLIGASLESVPMSHYGGKAVVQQMGIFTQGIITVLPESANTRRLSRYQNGPDGPSLDEAVMLFSCVLPFQPGPAGRSRKR